MGEALTQASVQVSGVTCLLPGALSFLLGLPELEGRDRSPGET